VTGLELTPEQDSIVSEYDHAPRAAGMRSDKFQLWGARWFFSRFGSVEAWRRAPLEQQLAVNVKVHGFVSGLFARGEWQHLPRTLIKRRPQFGRTVAMHHPVFFAEFRATASALGFNRHSTEAQWVALCRVCAVHAVPPEALTQGTDPSA
jgi:hypothetical protein